METIYTNRIAEIRREKKFLERKLNVEIQITGKKVIVEGSPLDEYEAMTVLEAINEGFSARTAILITSEDFVFEKINIKDFTRRKDMEVVRGRLIGTRGRTKRTIEQISGCEIKINDNTVSVIGPAENIQYAITAITNVIKGAKQSNVYKYLERINTEKRQDKL